MFIFVAYLLGKAIWVQMDIAGEFRHGTVSMSGRTFTFPDCVKILWWFFCPSEWLLQSCYVHTYTLIRSIDIFFFKLHNILQREISAIN